MAAPKIQDLITYVNKVITGQDWNANWQTVLSWFTSGNTDIKVKSIDVSATGGITNNGSFTQAGNVSIGGNLAVTGSVTGNTFAGDGSGLTGIVSAATVAYTPFAVNSGNVDANGKSDILYYTGGTGTLTVLKSRSCCVSLGLNHLHRIIALICWPFEKSLIQGGNIRGSKDKR